MKSPPPELSQPCSLADFVSEYRTLCAWLPSFKTLPDAHKFWNLKEVHVQVKFDNCSSPTTCRCTTFDHGCFGPSLDAVLKRPTVGARITFKGKDAVITDVIKTPNMTAIYAHAMCTPLREVRSLRLWHALRGWHRAVHRSLSSSALAEHCGSILRFVEKRCNAAGRPVAVSDLVRSAKVRAGGLFGEGLEDAVLARALNYHFNCVDPSGWHFQLRQRGAKMRTAQQLCPGVLHTRRRTLVTLKKKLPWWHGKLLTRSAFSFAKFLKRARPDTADTARLLDSRKRNCTRRRAADGTQDRREYEAAFLDEAVWTAANATVGPIGDSLPKAARR